MGGALFYRFEDCKLDTGRREQKQNQTYVDDLVRVHPPSDSGRRRSVPVRIHSPSPESIEPYQELSLQDKSCRSPQDGAAEPCVGSASAGLWR
jgi:hypothetical protein